MINFRIHNDATDSDYEVTAKTRDIVRWEASGKDKSFQKLMENLRLTDMYELAYFASIREGQFTGELPTFKDTCDLSFDEVDDAGNPSSPEA